MIEPVLEILVLLFLTAAVVVLIIAFTVAGVLGMGKRGVLLFCGVFLMLLNGRILFASQQIKIDVSIEKDVVYWANDVFWCGIASMVIGIAIAAMTIWLLWKARSKPKNMSHFSPEGIKQITRIAE